MQQAKTPIVSIVQTIAKLDYRVCLFIAFSLMGLLIYLASPSGPLALSETVTAENSMHVVLLRILQSICKAASYVVPLLFGAAGGLSFVRRLQISDRSNQ